LISVSNAGGVANSQIVLNNGFAVSSGKANVHVSNSGTVGSDGIEITGGSGANVGIALSNSSLYISSAASAFTIGGLDGDSTSTAQSLPVFIISTDSSTQANFFGTIEDAPSSPLFVIKEGPGVQKFSGSNTYTGSTTIQEGTLVVNGSLASELVINPGAALKGNGTILNTVTNSGTIAPGESIGTLVFTDYTNNGGTYDVEVNGAGQSSLIYVTDVATLNGGEVVVSSSDGTLLVQEPYTILTALTTRTGGFSGATTSLFVTPILTYDPNHVYLTLVSNLSGAADGCNQTGVANKLDGISGPTAAQSLLLSTLASLPLTQAQDALESLSGFQYTNDVWATEISTRRFLRRLYDPLRSQVTGCLATPTDPCGNRVVWGEAGVGFTTVRGHVAHKLSETSVQATAGIQRNFCGPISLGLAGSYEYDDVSYVGANAHRNTGYVALYGLYRPSLFYGLFDLAYGYTSNHLARTIKAGDLNYHVSSAPSVYTIAFYSEAGGDIKTDYILIQPFLGLQVERDWRSSIRENNANGWGLSIDSFDTIPISTRLGLHLSTCQIRSYLELSLDVAWNQLWSNNSSNTIGHFKDFGDSFRICGNPIDRSSFDYAVTLEGRFCQNFHGYFEVDGEWWRHANTIGLIAGLEFAW
jgi:autotransporter-associated beta strand protein